MKKLIPVAIVAFLVYYLFTQPQKAADSVNSGAHTAKDGAGSISTFISHLDGTTVGLLILAGIAAFIVFRK
jgi:branched-subunit amino acid transport protein AzlD